MRIAVAIGGLLLLVLAFGSWAYGNRETRLMWDQRYQSAFSAYGRTVQYVDSENEDYGRQYPDFQRALDDLEASATPYYGPADSWRRTVMVWEMRLCQSTLDNYRDDAIAVRRSADAGDLTKIGPVLDRSRGEIDDVYHCAETGEPDYAQRERTRR